MERIYEIVREWDSSQMHLAEYGTKLILIIDRDTETIRDFYSQMMAYILYLMIIMKHIIKSFRGEQNDY